MGKDVTVGIAGATGALGQELLSVLDDAPWRPERVVALARATTTAPSVAYGADSLPVDDLATADLGSLDALFVAVPRDVAGPLVDRAAAAGVPVIDLSGSQSERLDVPLVLPWLGVDALDLERARDVVAIPSGPTLLLASVLGPLRRAGYDEPADATVMLPAASWGRDAIDELSRQVVAMFNSGVPPRKVFPHGLAFDLLPQVGVPGATGWTADEVRTTLELARLTEARCDVTLVAAPLFSGLSATLRMELEADTPPEDLARVLQEAGVAVADHADLRRLPRPRRVEGVAGVQVARIRRTLDGRAAHLWLAVDGLRAAAVAAVGVAAVLLRQQHPDEVWRAEPAGDMDEDDA
ncbi:MAG: hypothetical protein H6733_02930 [Alphaproteobacteria bacterium]|nr:hypothetical protein [Alphaproteobacteria bacterium]